MSLFPTTCVPKIEKKTPRSEITFKGQVITCAFMPHNCVLDLFCTIESH